MELSDLPLQWLGPVLVPVAAVAVGWYGIYEPQHATLQRVDGASHNEQQRLALQRTIADHKRLIDGYQQRLAKTPDTDWLIAQTATVATAAKVQLTAVSPQRPVAETVTAVSPQQPAAETDRYVRLSIIVECELTYHELGAFVAALESAQPFIQVDQIEVGVMARAETKPGMPDAARRKIALTLSTIYMAAPSS